MSNYKYVLNTKTHPRCYVIAELNEKGQVYQLYLYDRSETTIEELIQYAKSKFNISELTVE